MDQLDQQVPYDVVLVTTLAHQVDAVIPSLQNSNAKCVHFMFNNFNPERLRDLVGLERCTFGMPFVMAHLNLDGKLNLRINPGQKTLHSDPRWVDLFRDAGLPSDLEKNMLLWLRCHTPLCIAFESISIAGERRHGGANWPESMSVARGMRAGFAILRGRGYRIYPSSKSILSHAPTFLIASMLWSLSRVTSFRTLLATGANECRALIEVMAEAGTNMKPALPEAVAALTAIKPTQKP
jgi:2-dehydropantoate 2-reductase